MSTTLTVKGYFSNGRSRVAGIHWPGGSARIPGKLGGAFLPEFQQRAVQYGKTFKSELEEAPKRADGLPKFEYMEITYSIYLQNGGSYVGHLYLALTPEALNRLTKEYGKPLNFDDVNVRQRFMREDNGLRKLKCIGVVDMTKYRNANAFWCKVRFYANSLYQVVFV